MSRALGKPANNNSDGSGIQRRVSLRFYIPTGLTRNQKSSMFTHTKHKTQTQFQTVRDLVLVVQTMTVPVVKTVSGEVRVFAGLRLQLRIVLSNLGDRNDTRQTV